MNVKFLQSLSFKYFWVLLETKFLMVVYKLLKTFYFICTDKFISIFNKLKVVEKKLKTNKKVYYFKNK